MRNPPVGKWYRASRKPPQEVLLVATENPATWYTAIWDEEQKEWYASDLEGNPLYRIVPKVTHWATVLLLEESDAP